MEEVLNEENDCVDVGVGVDPSYGQRVFGNTSAHDV